MRHILGLDLGTNSIGWALIDQEEKKIIHAGSRIIPMDAGMIKDYGAGNLQSPASNRTNFRGTRRLYERAELRRERLLRILNVLHFLPNHFAKAINFTDHPGQFIDYQEPLLPYRKDNNGHNEFIFKDSFYEMLEDFGEKHPDMIANGKKIPYDWTLYYLRKKALSHAIRREELAWIILNFNTKRGYYQLRGEEEETATSKNEEYKVLKVTEVTQMDEDKKHKGYFWYEIRYENGATQRKLSARPPYQIGDKIELIVTTNFDKNGNVATDKEGNAKIKLRAPKEDDWTLRKKRTEHELDESNKTVGAFIYDSLLTDPTLKVRGKLVRTIERAYYKKELIAILNKQKEFIPELQDHAIYMDCVRELYRSNEAHVKSVEDKDICDFIINDIIFYQRPLKSKKGEIANCPHEYYHYIDKDTGEIIQKPIKVIAKSNPLYQEFRLWQFLQNLKIIQREKIIDGRLRTDVDVTAEYLNSAEKRENLFQIINQRKDINQTVILKALHLSSDQYRWNYVEDKTLPGNETHMLINPDNLLNTQQEYELWHILYSVDDLLVLRKALTTFAQKNNLDEQAFVENHIHTKPFDSDYGAFSEKAIRKLLALMRTGKYYDAAAIDSNTQCRIQNIIEGKADANIYKQAHKAGIDLKDKNAYQFLPLWLAEYVIYDKKEDFLVWKKPEEIDNYLKSDFKQGSLRNPIVEMVLGETLRVVRDIWAKYGKIDEVHVEMGRDLKQPSDKRKKDQKRMAENERTNHRIRTLLQEFAADDCKINNVRPNSPSQLEILKIFEDGILHDETIEIDDDIQHIINDLGDTSTHVSHKDVIKYRLWLEQQYRSPYTGDVIRLTDLFTPAYEIEHIIPQSRYFDDSLSNKVVCESAINKLKSNQLGYEFILKEHGHIEDGHKVFDKVQYEEFVKKHYANNKGKMRKLLMEDIPDAFVQRQLNDSRYIARKTIEMLSPLVRITTEDGKIADNDKGPVSINVIATNGAITDRLKKDWGINQIWNDIIAPRFERLNQMTQSENYGQWVNKDGKNYFQINIPLSLRGFSKKRIDHRHHAMDAIVIACATRDHVNYLSNAAACSNQADLRYDLQHKLCSKEKTDDKGNYVWRFIKPWETFTQDTRQTLMNIVVSFKQNLRVINKMTNFYDHFENGKRVKVKQENGDGWAIRKSLHKATVSGAVRIQRKKKVKLADALDHLNLIVDKEVKKDIKGVIAQYHKFDPKTILKYYKDRKYLIGKKEIKQVEIWDTPTPEKADYSAVRVNLDSSFTKEKIASITDTGIQKILLAHLANCNDKANEAFSAEGIAAMNKNIKALNGGKDHKPILKVRKMESFGQKYSIGETGNKSKKYVEADKGTNLFYAVYENENGERIFESIPLIIAIERMKQNEPVSPYQDENGNKLLFVLSPGDLVYVADEGEHVHDIKDCSKIYKMVSSSTNRSFYVPHSFATPIVDKLELGSQNKIEKIQDGPAIKNICYKLKVDRLGNVELI